MQYRQMGSSGVNTSIVSFGSMRWPSAEECARIIGRGLDLGLNYVDTSTGYCGGQSEVWTGAAVKRRRREVLVSNKTQFGKAPRAHEVRAAIDRSLAVMGLDYLDFYQLWGLGNADTLAAALRKGGFVEGVRKAQKDGLVRHGMGFTFHGEPATFRAAIDTGEFVTATVSYNLLNRGEEDDIAYAKARGVGVVVMNPLAGGVLALAGNGGLDFLKEGGAGPSRGSLRFLFANPGITTGIVGFRSVDEVDAAVAALNGADSLDEAYRQDLIRKMDRVKLLEGSFCTGCGYCKDCPSGVEVSKYMQTMRDFRIYSVAEERLADWIWSKYAHMDPVAQLEACTACGACEDKCPQHLKIVDEIRRGKAAITGSAD